MRGGVCGGVGGVGGIGGVDGCASIGFVPFAVLFVGCLLCWKERRRGNQIDLRVNYIHPACIYATDPAPHRTEKLTVAVDLFMKYHYPQEKKITEIQSALASFLGSKQHMAEAKAVNYYDVAALFLPSFNQTHTVQTQVERHYIPARRMSSNPI